MKLNSLKKMYEFGNRHLFLSIYICLLLMSICANFYWAIHDSIKSTGSIAINITIHGVLGLAILDMIPVFIISWCFYYFLSIMKKKENDTRFYKKFVFSIIPAFIITLMFLTIYFSVDCSLEHFVFAFICSLIYAFFFSIYSKSSSIGTIFISILMNLLMGPIYQVYILVVLLGGV